MFFLLFSSQVLVEDKDGKIEYTIPKKQNFQREPTSRLQQKRVIEEEARVQRRFFIVFRSFQCR